MKQGSWTVASALCGGLLLVAAGTGAAPATAKAKPDLAQSVRKELAGLPYYGVFDLLTYEVSEKGVVTLGGYVYHTPLKADAERAVKKVEGVSDVENRIEALPASIMDEEIRGAVYRALYRDSPLARYGTPEDVLLGSRPRFRAWGRGFRGWSVFAEPRWSGWPFLGMEPVGNYAIHIIVENGNVTLAGVVDNQADKDIAQIKAGGVAGVFKVTNDIQLEAKPARK
jgi:hyperosmotically inducible protein